MKKEKNSKDDKVIKGNKTLTGKTAAEIEIEPVDEAEKLDEISIQQRIKRKAMMRRLQPRLRVARRRAERRGATMDVVKRRAQRRARNAVKSRLSFGRKGMGASEKKRIENLANKRKALITRLARRKRVDVRRDAINRVRIREDINENFENKILNRFVHIDDTGSLVAIMEEFVTKNGYSDES